MMKKIYTTPAMTEVTMAPLAHLMEGSPLGRNEGDATCDDNTNDYVYSLSRGTSVWEDGPADHVKTD